MSSVIECSSLLETFLKIKQQANEEYAVILFLGITDFGAVQVQELMKAVMEIKASHLQDCQDCYKDKECLSLLFDYCSLETETNLQSAIQRLANSLAVNTKEYTASDRLLRKKSSLSHWSISSPHSQAPQPQADDAQAKNDCKC